MERDSNKDEKLQAMDELTEEVQIDEEKNHTIQMMLSTKRLLYNAEKLL